MPLTRQDRQFLEAISRHKIYVLVMAAAVLCYLRLARAEDFSLSTLVLGLALCGVFWLTQRLLSFISVLDYEVTRLSKAVSKSLPEEERKTLRS